MKSTVYLCRCYSTQLPNLEFNHRGEFKGTQSRDLISKLDYSIIELTAILEGGFMGQRRRKQDLDGNFQCPACEEWYPPIAFYPNIRTLDGISTYCKTCHRAKQKADYSPSAQARKQKERADTAERLLQEQLVAYREQLEQGLFDWAALDPGETETVTMHGKRYQITCLEFDEEDDPVAALIERGRILHEKQKLLGGDPGWSEEDFAAVDAYTDELYRR